MRIHFCHPQYFALYDAVPTSCTHDKGAMASATSDPQLLGHCSYRTWSHVLSLDTAIPLGLCINPLSFFVYFDYVLLSLEFSKETGDSYTVKNGCRFYI